MNDEIHPHQTATYGCKNLQKFILITHSWSANRRMLDQKVHERKNYFHHPTDYDQKTEPRKQQDMEDPPADPVRLSRESER